jgi:dihydropyrimidine dehydrogenase (NAD+) subunit PreA
MDLSTNLAGITAPNPFWLASAPPTNSGYQICKAFEAGWGGAVWKTLAVPVVNVSSRYGAWHTGERRLGGFNNIELISDRPVSDNLKEIEEVKKRFPEQALVVSLMFQSRAEWEQIVKDCENAGADGLELNFGCPHGMCERGMGSAVGQEPSVVQTITEWVAQAASIPVVVKLTPNITDVTEAGRAAVAGGADAVSLINTIQSLMGVDLDAMAPAPVVDGKGTHGGYCGPAVKPIALNMVRNCAQDPNMGVPISGIGGVSTWRDAAEFIALGADSVQICTAVMQHGYGIIRELIPGLQRFMKEKGYRKLADFRGLALPNTVRWEELNLNYKVLARIDEDRCIGCQLCYTACEDGAHQAIALPANTTSAGAVAEATTGAAASPSPATNGQGVPVSRIPQILDDRCVGCNLCSLVCPVEDCITMEPLEQGLPVRTWADRVAEGDVPTSFDDPKAGGHAHPVRPMPPR